MQIVELHSPAEHTEALPPLREVYPWLEEGRYWAFFAEMIDDGYPQSALRKEAAEAVALAGVAVHINIYYGRYLYVQDLVVKEGERSKGYGEGRGASVEREDTLHEHLPDQDPFGHRRLSRGQASRTDRGGPCGED
jgi:hypothetical protein